MRHGRRTLSYSIPLSAPPTSPSSALADLFLSASLHQSLPTPHSNSGYRSPLDFSSLPSPIPDSAILRLFRLPSLSPDSKLSLFPLLSSLPSFSPSPSSLSALLLSISRAGRLSDLPNLLRFALSSSTVDPTTFSYVLSAFIRAQRYDLAIAALDDAVALHDTAASVKVLTTRTYCSIMLALLKKSQLDLALPMFQNLLASSAELFPRACNQLLLALRKSDMQDDFRYVFDELSKRSFPFDTWGYNICIHSFGEWRQLGTALKLFNDMKAKGLEPELCTYNTVIGALCAGGKVGDALAVYEEMKGSDHEPDRLTYQNLILGCCKSYRVDEAVRVFREMEFKGIKADTLAFNTLLAGLMKARKLTEACQLFEKMFVDGVRASHYSHNIMINGLFRNDRPAAAFALFSELKKRGQFVDDISYSIVIFRLCKEGRVSEALDLVKEMEEREFAVDLVTITSLLIGLHKNGRWDSVERLVKHVRDTVLLPSVLRWKENMETSFRAPQDKGKDFTPLFPCVGSLRDVIGLIDHAPENGSKEPGSSSSSEDEWSSSPYLDKLAENFKPFGGSQFFTASRGQRIQEDGIKSFDMDMMNTYLSIFLSNGKLGMACKLFEIFRSLGSEPVGYTYNSLLNSFVKKGYLKDALGIVQDMTDNKCPADIATVNLIIQGLSKMGKGDLATSILDWSAKNGGYLDIVLYNTVIHALGKAGRVDEANKLFKKMTETGINPDVVTFNTLIEVNSKAGRVKEAYKFLRKMLAAGCMPNHVTDTILDFLESEIEKIRLHKASIKRNEDFNPYNI